jgi:hypothetical protein
MLFASVGYEAAEFRGNLMSCVLASDKESEGLEGKVLAGNILSPAAGASRELFRPRRPCLSLVAI